MRLNYSQSNGLESFFCGQGREEVRRVIGLHIGFFLKLFQKIEKPGSDHHCFTQSRSGPDYPILLLTPKKNVGRSG